VARFLGATVAVVLVLSGMVGVTGCGANEQPGAEALFAIRLEGTAGPLTIGLPRKEAMRYLNLPTFPLRRTGASCARYDMGIGVVRGAVEACSDAHSQLAGYTVEGDQFCLRSGACARATDARRFSR
jgi:hypothetical protein